METILNNYALSFTGIKGDDDDLYEANGKFAEFAAKNNLSPDIQAHLFGAMRECFTNHLKHTPDALRRFARVSLSADRSEGPAYIENAGIAPGHDALIMREQISFFKGKKGEQLTSIFEDIYAFNNSLPKHPFDNPPPLRLPMGLLTLAKMAEGDIRLDVLRGQSELFHFTMRARIVPARPAAQEEIETGLEYTPH